jgi:hypothetical protein
VSIFSDSLGTILDEIHRAEGEPEIVVTVLGQAPVLLAPDGRALRGAFDAAGVLVPMENGILQRSASPQLGIRLSDYPSGTTERTTRITVAGVEYQVSDAEPDGQGGATLLLRKVGA